MTEQCLHWHFDVHRQTKSKLHFTFAQVGKKYDRTKFFKAVTSAFFQSLGISSFGVYEVYGQWDLVIKAWVPMNHLYSYEQKIKAWGGGNEETSVHSRTDIFFQQQSVPLLVGRNDRTHPELVATVSDLQLSRLSTLDQFQQLGDGPLLKGRLRPGPGLRVIFVIENPHEAADDEVIKHMLTSFLDNVTKLDGIKNSEIYVGTEKFWLLLDAFVEYNDYNKIAALEQAATSSGFRASGCRTNTFLCTNNQLGVLEVDELPRSLLADTLTIDKKTLLRMLSGNEDEKTEVKSSIRIELGTQFLNKKDTPEIQNSIERKILSTLVAFLNCDGGTIVLGAAEDVRVNDELREVLLETCEKVGQYFVVGISADVHKGDQDKYYRHISSIVSANISVEAAGLMRVAFHELGDKIVCTITVPPTLGHWYLKSKGTTEFHVRTASETKQLKGSEQENWQRQKRQRQNSIA